MLSPEQEKQLVGYVESSIILSITFPWEFNGTSDNLLVVSRVRDDVFHDVINSDGATTVLR